MNRSLRALLFLTPLAAVLLYFGLEQRAGASGGRTLMLAHNMDENHPVHRGMVFLAEEVFRRSGGRHRLRLYPNGQLGTEREVLELVQYGAVAMTKVSSLSLESFVPRYAVFNLPYIFKSEEQCFRVLDGPIGAEMLAASREKNFIGLTYYHSGARGFYATRPILRPEDLRGLKMRVMGSSTAIQMLQAMGGSPAPMPYGEIYTALQQGVIDGAENNITALTLSRHGEVAKFYSLSEHIIAPDVLVISTNVWDNLPGDLQAILREAAAHSRDHQRVLWATMTADLFERTLAMGVRVQRPDLEPFRARVQALHRTVAGRDPALGDLMRRIQAVP